MKHVQLSSIEKAIKKVDNLDDDALERLSETHALAQPVLLGYAMSAADEYENENLEGLIIYYFSLILESFAQESINPKSITEEDIDAFEEPFFEMLDSYFESDNEDILDEFCDQPNLTQFMAMEVSTPDVDGTQLDDDTATQLFIVTVAMIGLLSQSDSK